VPELAIRPAHLWVPPYDTTHGDLAGELGGVLGLVPDAEQQLVLDAIFAEAEPGTPACFEVGVIAPRQNLKTAALQIAALTYLFVFDVELIVWTAHLFPTARKAFEGMCALIDANPDLKRRCRDHRTANGSETIERKSGQKIEFHARSKGGGRGFTGDKVILDEGLFLTPAMLGALLPTMATREGAQVLYASSAGLRESETLRDVRDRGRAGGDPSLAWFEWCAQHRDCAAGDCRHLPGTEGCAYDDEELWAQANVALGRRITKARLRRFRRAMPPAEWAREFLGWWDDPPDAGDTAIPWQPWKAACDDTSTIDGTQIFGLEVSEDRTWSTFAAAGRSSVGEFAHGEVVDTRRGTGWVVGRAVELQSSWGGSLAVADGSPAATLIPDLEDAGVDVERLDTAAQTRACAQLHDAVVEGRFKHRDQPVLDMALRGAEKRAVRDAWVWSQKRSSVDISPLAAVTWATFAAGLGDDYDILDSIG